MPRFVFQLDGLLRQRKNVEQEKQRQLALRQAHLTELQNELRRVNEQVQVTNDDVWRNHLTGRLDLGFLAAHRRFMISMQREALNVVQKLALSQRQVEEAQKELAQAAKARKSIEKLREKHRERWMQRLSRRELSEQDELGMQLSYWTMREDAEASS
jgi:flagellar protein FliJ